MTSRPTPEHYRPVQKILHWVVVLGLMFQFANNESIVRVNEANNSGAIPDGPDTYFAWLHVGVGSVILISVLARLYFRHRYGVPGHAPGTSAQQAKTADLMHRALYVLLLCMVVTGMITWNGIAPLGQVHFIINVILIFLVLGHAGAALYNQFITKDGTLSRMMPNR